MANQITNAVNNLLKSDEMKVELVLNNPKKFHNKNLLRVAYNKFILTIQQVMVPCHFKNWLLRTTGMSVGHDACIPHYISFDPYFPELISVGEGCIVGGACNLIAHELKGNKLVLGKVDLGERVLVGGLVPMHPGSKVSEHSIVASTSELDGIVPEGELWMGRPAKMAVQFTAEDIEKYFKKSDGNYKQYYEEFYNKLKELKKDKAKIYLKIYYNGNRLNAGNDWWRARNVVCIFWSGVFVELAQRMPWNWLRKLFYRIAGAKIGKNVYIGKGVVLDHLMTPYITLEDNVRLEDKVYLDCHDYTISQTVFGRTTIKKGAHLGKGVFAKVGTQVGENTIIEENSAIEREIPANEVWGGWPAKHIRKIHT